MPLGCRHADLFRTLRILRKFRSFGILRIVGLLRTIEHVTGSVVEAMGGLPEEPALPKRS